RRRRGRLRGRRAGLRALGVGRRGARRRRVPRGWPGKLEGGSPSGGGRPPQRPGDKQCAARKGSGQVSMGEQRPGGEGGIASRAARDRGRTAITRLAEYGSRERQVL